jgi:hypothetical protein
MVLFTSSIQLDHLLEGARSEGIESEVRTALRDHVVIGSIGPVMTEALISHGFSPAIVRRHPKMPSLVKQRRSSLAMRCGRKELSAANDHKHWRPHMENSTLYDPLGGETHHPSNGGTVLSKDSYQSHIVSIVRGVDMD